MTHERPTHERIVREIRWLMFVCVPLFSAAAGAILVLQADPEQPGLALAGALSTGSFCHLLVLLRLGQPRKRHFLGVLFVAAVLGTLNAPAAAILAGPHAMHVDNFGELVGLSLFGAIVVSPLSAALGASFGLAWLAALTRFSQASERAALTDPSSLALRLGAGALGLALVSTLGVSVGTSMIRPGGIHGYQAMVAAGTFPGSQLLIFLAFTSLILGGLLLMAYGLRGKYRLLRFVRLAKTGKHDEFCVGPVDLEPTPSLLALTRDRACERVLCRRSAAKGDGAYRLNQDHLTPWALMPERERGECSRESGGTIVMKAGHA